MQLLLSRTNTTMTQKIQKNFVFKFPTCTTDQQYKLDVPIEIPFKGCIIELTERIISVFQIPIYVKEDLQLALELFAKESTSLFYDDLADNLLERTANGDLNTEDIIHQWEKAFKEETSDYAARTGPSDEDIFATAYHRLVHSSSLDAMLAIEQSYAMAVHNLCVQRDDEINRLTSHQLEEMEEMVKGLHITSTEQNINELAVRHFSGQALTRGRWSSQLHALHGAQRAEYRDWIGTQLSGALTPTSSPTSYSPPMAPPTLCSNNSLEESFTIHLGSQLKHMHNIRILSMDVMDLCSTKHINSGIDCGPQRLHTALGLYSNSLCGLVLLTDNSIESHDLALLSNHSTEFHFATMDDQLELIREETKEAVKHRNSMKDEDQPDRINKNPLKDTKNLQTGDIYITKHSNLSQVHVVFHLVVDESTLRSGDINSRHPAILGLRNALKIASCNDVTTLTIPVLLRHEMSEEMTVSWCVRRAELVFKCVKGFMIEAASWGGADLCTLQLLLPPGISEDLFTTLANMIPYVFRVANPLVLK